MTQRQRQEAAMSALRMIPTKWGIAIVALLIGYVLLQPKLNEWFGLSLPSLSNAVDDRKATPPKSTSPSKSENESDRDEQGEKGDKSTKSKTTEKASSSAKVSEGQLSSSAKTPPLAQPTKPSRDQAEPDAKPEPKPKTSSKAAAKTGVETNDKKFGLLVDMGRDRFKSPEGLIYGPGSEEGHRLKHIERHLEDQPNRPGSHGVFDGEMKAFLEAIDDAYARAKKGAKGTKKTNDDGAIVYEASFEKPIGFLGGQEGKRKRNPALKKLRIVVRGESVITAFPF